MTCAVPGGAVAVTDDPLLLATAEGIDVILEVTGAVEDALPPILSAIENGKHVLLMNAELDGTVGPILARMAEAAGVVFSNVDGDQPGVQMNLWRFVRGIGLRPVLCGNIKGLHDPYRTPATQAGFARRWGQNPHMVTSFADGTKISFEQAIVANATGMTLARRGMLGPTVPAGTANELSSPTMTSKTSWPRSRSAFATAAPDRSDTSRSDEGPPFSTATFLNFFLPLISSCPGNFPRYGKRFRRFSTLWKIFAGFFHTVEKSFP